MAAHSPVSVNAAIVHESLSEAYRKGFETGYFYGRIDEMNDAPYDDRIVSERYSDDSSSAINTSQPSCSATNE